MLCEIGLRVPIHEVTHREPPPRLTEKHFLRPAEALLRWRCFNTESRTRSAAGSVDFEGTHRSLPRLPDTRANTRAPSLTSR